MGKLPSHGDKMGMKKGPWTPEEDLKLSTFIRKNGHGCWRALPSKAGLQRCGKSCRLRWINYLSPDIKRGEFSVQEEQSIIQLHALLGNRWSTIASHLPKRTDNEIKNYWNIHLKKKISKMGIDPITHKPKNHALWCDQAKDFANLCHMAQWESARLEAEARALVRATNPNRHLLDATTAKAPPPQPPPLRPPCLDILKVWVQINSGMVNISNAIFNGFLASNGILDHSQSSLFNTDNHRNEVKGIMENSMELHETAEPIDSIASYSGLPDFVEGYTSPFSSWNVLEDANSNYWGVP